MSTSASSAQYEIKPAHPNHLATQFKVGDTVTVKFPPDAIEFHTDSGLLLRLQAVNIWGNPYNSPERCGLEIIAEYDTGGSYEFDMVVVWREKKTGKLFAGADSGCSCPSPYENFDSLSDMTELKRLDDIRPLVPKDGGSMSDELVFLNKVREALRVG